MEAGHSRVPVYRDTPDNIVGMILVLHYLLLSSFACRVDCQLCFKLLRACIPSPFSLTNSHAHYSPSLCANLMLISPSLIVMYTRGTVTTVMPTHHNANYTTLSCNLKGCHDHNAFDVEDFHSTSPPPAT